MGKRYKIIKPKHGYFRGGEYNADVVPTIDTGIGKWHFLIGETEMADEIKCEQVGILSGGKWDKCHEANRRVYLDTGLSPTITTTDGSSPKHNNRVVEPNYRFFEQAFETLKENHCEVGDTIDAYNKRVNKDGISPTITTRPEGFKTAILPVVPTIWGSKQKNCAKKKDGICPTLTSAMGDGGGQIPMHNYDYRIRKMTERECGRLMGVKGEDCEKIAKNQSTSRQYHLYGDSIVTTCLMAIFGELFEIDYETKINNLIGELKQ